MENKKSKQEWYRVTITNEETGEAVNDFVTKAIMFVALFENDETRRRAAESGSLCTSGITVERLASELNWLELLALVEGVQEMLQETMEDHPEMELLARLVKSKRTEVTKEET